eukprot:TRINITY_DN1187_c0_g1_i1.p2 TRINITY_DN1187_c0_g1~~TRINITY_DN1187_c0_g1_i1.p2  ORF type:complete len:111 (-),score=42.22 TRINITY_DN1187_c0_g1_i1:423-755(-)
MGKSIRSKVKKKFRTIKREALEPAQKERFARLAEKDKEAMAKHQLDPKLASAAVMAASMDMQVDRSERAEHQYGSSMGKRIGRKSRRPKNAKAQNLKKKVNTYFKKKKKK